MKDVIKGKVYVLGDNIDTDVTIPARYLTTMDPEVLRKHAMEDLDPKQYPIPFLNKDGSCDYKIIIAGRNFGCGSSREHAPIALRAAGVEAVVAQTFARIYYRNSVSGGIILPLESFGYLPDKFQTGDEVELIVSEPHVRYAFRTTEDAIAHKESSVGFSLRPLDGTVKAIIEAGGLTAYNKRILGLV